MSLALTNDEIPPLELNGAFKSQVRILFDAKTKPDIPAAMAWLYLQPGQTFVRPSPRGRLYCYMLTGRMTFGDDQAAEDREVVVLDDGVAPLQRAAGRVQALLLFAPAGAEQAYRCGEAIPEPSGPSTVPPKFLIGAQQQQHLYGDKLDVSNYFSDDQVSFHAAMFYPGASLQPRAIPNADQFICWYEGAGIGTLNGEKIEIGWKTHIRYIYVPRGVAFGFDCDPGGRAGCVSFFVPGGTEKRFTDGIY